MLQSSCILQMSMACMFDTSCAIFVCFVYVCMRDVSAMCEQLARIFEKGISDTMLCESYQIVPANGLQLSLFPLKCDRKRCQDPLQP